MTSHRDVWISCDLSLPGAYTAEDPVVRCEGQYPEDAGDDRFTDVTIPVVRAAAKADGWRATRDGRDTCGPCIIRAARLETSDGNTT